ncbi:MAG: MBL fold metallo-hydrolase [Bacteroidales bacterium]|nr:MBL fold metallo-hydrolase [Bacteroidales bacterium]
MKKSIIAGIIIIGITVIISLVIRFGFFSGTSGLKDDPVRDCIKTVRLTESVIVVNVASDAVTFIRTVDGIVVIDAGITPSLTARYRKIVEKEFQRKDFLYLINTHAHHDHTGGNSAFPGVRIIGHENCRTEMLAGTGDPEKIKAWTLKIIEEYENEPYLDESGPENERENACQKLRFQHLYNDLQKGIRTVKPPDITFTDSLTIYAGGLAFHLFYFGKAHSGSDILVFIPGLKILMCGDLFSPGGIPAFSNGGDTLHWIAAMDRLMTKTSEIETVIGGHGQIMNRNDLERFNEYIRKKQDR